MKKGVIYRKSCLNVLWEIEWQGIREKNTGESSSIYLQRYGVHIWRTSKRWLSVWVSLTMQRIYFLGNEIYECVENLNPKYFNDFLCPKGLSCQWWDSNRLHQTKFNTVTFGYRSFSYYGAKVWNTLSPGTKILILSAYEINLKKWCLQMHWCKVLDYIWWYLCSYYYLINFMCLCWFSCQLYNGSFFNVYYN